MSASLPGGRRYRPPSGRVREATRVVVIDNYDSFTFNLVQYLLELGAVVDVYRNDAVTAAQVLADRASHLLLSPGPGRPQDSGVCQDLCAAVCDPKRPPLPTLGVCLGHQTLCEVHGATVERAARIMHGKRSPMIHAGAGVYAGLPSPFEATRYHSLIVDQATLPDQLIADAHTPEGELMGVHHRDRPVFGVQYHPESILTEHGHRLLENFLNVVAGDPS
ncbi:Anthranilate synthase, amidotransferase component [Enhygromyxa salina]|uniref:Anthranilate synthase, amidotransferase component n=1 Tax=Enhygromyxa salina TaxID=215803 RepID=A0A0C2D2G8_9BACT|nr:aminodeoxychorismate/anthranilate synthase component II [Enhygromyxa salina]KIG15970.1 Anthranilate synthase, amidotransferase component [Enhygromyxa salina]